MPDFITEKTKYLAIVIILFNRSIRENKFLIAVDNKAKKISITLSANNPTNLNSRTNLKIDELFLKA